MQIQVQVTVPVLDRVLAECRAIGAALDRRCTEIEVRRRERRDGAWIFELAAAHPRPQGAALYLRAECEDGTSRP